MKDDFYFVCSGVIEELENFDAPWRSKTEFIQNWVDARELYDELCVEFFGSVPEFCEVTACTYRTRNKLCEKHLETEAAQEEMFSE